MSNFRAELSEKNNYYLPAERTYELMHFCKQYPTWKKALESLTGLSRRPADLDIFNKVHGISDPTARCAMARQHYGYLIEMIEKAAKSADSELSDYIVTGVTEGVSYDILQARYNIPCCREVYYKTRRKFYWELSQLRK